MKIAIIAHSYYPIAEPFAGGLEMITYQLVRELVVRGHDVDLYAHPDSCHDLPLVPMLRESYVLSRFDGEEIPFSGMSEGELAQTLIYHDVMSRIAAEEYDIVHNHSLHHVPILLGNELGKRFVTSLHTPAFIQLKIGFLGLSRVAQTVTTVSNRQQHLFEGVVRVDRTVYNGIDLDRWQPDYHGGGGYFFWMGRMCKEKAPHQAIQACIRAGKRLLLAGPVSNQTYFDSEVKPLLGEEGIEYLGHLTHTQIAPYLREAVGYLFTSVWEEPYGLTIAESLACGTPVIAYRVGAATEILTDDVGILVGKEDIGGLVKAMSSLTHIDRRACRRRAESFCSSAVMVESYLDLYRHLLGRTIYTTQLTACPSSPTTPTPTVAVTAGTPTTSVV